MQDHGDSRDDAVDRVLDEELQALRVDRPHLQQRQAAEVLDRHALDRDLEEARNERGGHAELAAAAHHAEHHRVRCGGEGEDDVLDVVLLEHALEVPACAEDRQVDRASRRSRAGRCRGTRPDAGRTRTGPSCRLATSWPTRPAPTISVERPPSPRAMARARAMKRPVRPTESAHRGQDARSARSAPTCSGSSSSITRSEITAIVATAVVDTIGADLVEQVRAQPIAVHAADRRTSRAPARRRRPPTDAASRARRAGGTSPASRHRRRGPSGNRRGAAGPGAGGPASRVAARPSWVRAAALASVPSRSPLKIGR